MPSKYKDALKAGLEKISIQERLYGQWPSSIATGFGHSEIKDAFSHIETIEQSKEEIPEWDDEGSDDAWRVQMNISRLIASASNGHEQEIITHLTSENRAVRYWAAHIAAQTGSRKFLKALELQLANEEQEPNVGMLKEAIESCSKNPFIK